MESPKADPVEYDGKDAIATLIAVYGGTLSEAEAKTKVEQELLQGPPRRREVLRKMTRDVGIMLAVLPAAYRREVMVRVAKKLIAHDARQAQQREFRRQYPALRDSKMLRIAGWFFCQQTIEQVFVPIVSDYLLEYRRARAEGRWKGFVVKMRHWHAFANACGLEKAYPWFERLAHLAWYLWNKLL